jgi:hypothetical protein
MIYSDHKLFVLAALSACVLGGTSALSEDITADQAVDHDASKTPFFSAQAWQQWQSRTLGTGRLFTNDIIGDGQDRWRSGSYALSVLRGDTWSGAAPAQLGELLEYRLRGEVIAPENLTTPAAGDRPYVGALSLGLHTYAQRGDLQFRGGLDVVAVGPQTGVGDFQNTLHDAFGLDESNFTTQLGNAFYPTASGEISRTYAIGNTELRPFAEVQVGVESYARVGMDLNLGTFPTSALYARDVTTGHRYQTISEGIEPGAHFVLGTDVAHVFSSEYLPSEDGYVLEDIRARVRAGVTLSAPKVSAFYGLTWLSPEFEAQTESQVVGSMNMKFDF